MSENTRQFISRVGNTGKRLVKKHFRTGCNTKEHPWPHYQVFFSLAFTKSDTLARTSVK